MLESQRLLDELKDLENKRKSGEIGPRVFYKGLLDLLADLKEVLAHENITDAQIRKQIPLLLVFLKSQINELAQRNK